MMEDMPQSLAKSIEGMPQLVLHGALAASKSLLRGWNQRSGNVALVSTMLLFARTLEQGIMCSNLNPKLSTPNPGAGNHVLEPEP
jgi:hypothetical protein